MNIKIQNILEELTCIKGFNDKTFTKVMSNKISNLFGDNHQKIFRLTTTKKGKHIR